MKKVIALLLIISPMAFAQDDTAMLQKQLEIMKSRHLLVLQERQLRMSQEVAQDKAYEKQLLVMQARLKPVSPAKKAK